MGCTRTGRPESGNPAVCRRCGQVRKRSFRAGRKRRRDYYFRTPAVSREKDEFRRLRKNGRVVRPARNRGTDRTDGRLSAQRSATQDGGSASARGPEAAAASAITTRLRPAKQPLVLKVDQ